MTLWHGDCPISGVEAVLVLLPLQCVDCVSCVVFLCRGS
jgi:hypothetical protein